jgi:hypothetical protein
MRKKAHAMPTPSPKRKIVSSLPKGILHRGGIWTCPHCDWQAPDHSTAPWAKAAVMLVTDIVHGKHGSIVYVSECPGCFKKSWVHVDLSTMGSTWNDDFPAEWNKKAKEVRAARHLAAMQLFMRSQCSKCRWLRKFECDTLPIVECTYGPGEPDHLRSSFTDTECTQFTPLDDNLVEFRNRMVHFYGRTDGSFAIPNSCEGDLLKIVAKVTGIIPPS